MEGSEKEGKEEEYGAEGEKRGKKLENGKKKEGKENKVR